MVIGSSRMFADRRDAGHRLAARLASWRGTDCVVLGLPCGGIVVADEVAAGLAAALDVVVAHKLRAPADRECGIGAVVAAATPEVALDDSAIATLGVLPDYVCDEVALQLAEARLREALLREGRRPVLLAGRIAILVDDGMAAGNTMAAAVRLVRRARPSRILVATPVASLDAIARLRPLVDEVVSLHAPQRFGTIGAFYRDFPPVSDGEVGALLARARTRKPCCPATTSGGSTRHAGKAS
jgi:putative phosphoribosyl transferase